LDKAMGERRTDALRANAAAAELKPELEATDATAVNAEPNHLHFADRLKVTLLFIVIMHHAALAWTKDTWWPIKSEATSDLLGKFIAVNNAFFMGLFFLISAYFHPTSFDKKRAAGFLKGRLKRLGIPLFVYLTCVVPFLTYAYYLNFRGHEPMSFWKYYVRIYFGTGRRPSGWAGPVWPDAQFLQMWFVDVLLVFAFLYAFWRLVTRKLNIGSPIACDKPLKPLTIHLSIAGYAVVLAIASYIVRIWWPIYEWNALFDLIQIEWAHFPLYFSCFVIGAIACRRNWLRRAAGKTAYVWLTIGIAMAVSMYTPVSEKLLPITYGGKTLSAFVYALQESFLGAGLCFGLVMLFYEKFNSPPGRFTKALQANTYCVYIIHVPVIVILQYALVNYSLHPLVMFAVTTAVCIPLSFVISEWGLRRIQCVRAIL